VKRIESSDGQVVHEGQPDVRMHLSAKPQQIEFVRQAMLGAVENGTARPAAVKGLSVAGKTGTAQYDTIVDGKTQRLERAWFIGFAPYDQPQFAISVLIEAAKEGSHTAAAVASKVFAQAFGKTTEDSRPAEVIYAD
jgi:cell division protein FtsI/penicillin-binding protein 2